MKLLILLSTFSFLFSCRPEQVATEFNELISVPVGEDILYTTDEETELTFTYEVANTNDSINLTLQLSSLPSFGSISCSNLNSTKLSCKYLPKPDFYGIDKIQFITKDGDVFSSKKSTITIDVLNIDDSPLAINKGFSTLRNTPLDFVIPKAIDSDSLSTELSYAILQLPNNGTLSNCNLAPTNLNCKYTPNQNFVGSDSFTYRVTDLFGNSSNIATIYITVNESNTGVQNAIEVFTPKVDNLKGVDIVWVIDDSGSMSNNQTKLKESFNSFVNNFVKDDKPLFDFQMAVTKTSAYLLNSSQNPFRLDSNGNIYDLSSGLAQADSAKFKQNFLDAASVGTSGSACENVLWSMDRAYQNQIPWYRDNDHLLVYIMLSDESEQSTFTMKDGNQSQGCLNQKTNKMSFDSVDSWMTHFESLKNDSSKVKMYPIHQLNKDVDNRFKDIASRSGTFVSDIDKDFDNILDSISTAVSVRIKSFELTKNRYIHQSSIKVHLNNTLLDSSKWNFVNNSIELIELPPDNATIKITYQFEDA